MSDRYTATRYKFRSPAYRLARRIAQSSFATDVRGRLHIIPEMVGGLFAAYVLVGLIRGLAVVATIAGVR